MAVLSNCDLRMLVGRLIMKTLGFCAAGLAETPKRIDQSAIRHLPQLWEILFGSRYERIIFLTIWSALLTTVGEDKMRILLISA